MDGSTLNMGKEEAGKKEGFLSNLGRATMRGVRRCQKCGTLNGTRGYACKNSSCDVIFKEIGGRKKPSTEPRKIDSGSAAQIFSVRIRDKGPDYRGFVQLSSLHENNLIAGDSIGDELVMPTGARCYVEACQRNKFMVRYNSNCTHIRSAAQCLKEAEPLTFKNSTLNSLPMPPELKGEMWQLATDTPGPLVQRVSKSIMVVKCKPDHLHPLGFLHFSFHQTKGRKESDYRFYCSCRSFKFNSSNRDSVYRRCVHLYACIVAFASDENLEKEFGFYVSLVKNDFVPDINFPVGKEELDPITGEGDTSDDGNKNQCNENNSIEDVDERSFLILNDSSTGAPCQVEVEVLREDSDLLDIPMDDSHPVVPDEDIDSKLEIQLQTEETIHLQTAHGETISVHQLPDNISLQGIKRKHEEDNQDSQSSLNNKNSIKKFDSKKLMPNIFPKKSSEPEECDINFPFLSWLESVNERITQAMHYGFSEKPDPLVFHLPKSFFWCLLERINQLHCAKKRRISYETQTFIRKDAVPLGKFSKFTWKLMSLAHIREVFRCNTKPLQTTRFFIQQKDGSYKPDDSPLSLADDPIARQGGIPIRPQECKTCLRVGPSPLSNRDAVPFIIEWIPDILPLSQIGELRIKFEYDHYCNGQLVVKQPLVLSKPSTLKQRSLCPPLAPRPPSSKISLPTTNSDNVQISIPISSENTPSTDAITILTF